MRNMLYMPAINLHRHAAHCFLPVFLLSLMLFTCCIARSHAAGGDFFPPFPVLDAVSGKNEAVSSVTDSAGNLIITGYQNLNADANDNYYTVKFKADGSGLSWPAKSYNRNGGSDQATAVTVDSNNDIIVTGISWNGFNKDVHTIKYDGATGDIIWEATFNGGTNADDYATGITVDSLNNVYVGGYTNADGNDDYFVIAYNGSTGAAQGGGPVWKATWNGTADNTDKLTAITAGNGGIVVTGYSSNGTDFDYSTIKFDYSGAKLWNTRYSSTGSHDDWGQLVKMDPSGNVVVSGFVSNASNKSIYTAKYAAANGNLVWEYTYNSPDAGHDAEPAGLYIGTDGDAYVTGYVATISEGANIFIARYSDPASGTIPDVRWEKSFNSGLDNTDKATAVIGDSSGNIYVTGFSFSGSTNDIMTLKYKGDNGTLLWQKIYNGIDIGNSASLNDKPVGIGVSSTDEIYVGGWSGAIIATNYDYVAIRYEAGALNPPTSLTVGTITKDGSSKYSIPLTWVDNSGNEDGFILERKVGEFGTYAPVLISAPPDKHTLDANVTTYTDTGLPSSGLDEGKYYYYRVKAFNAANGNSHYSNEVRVLTLVVTPIDPVWNYLYNGLFDSDDIATSIAVGPDNHPVVTGYTLDYAPGYSSGSTSTDYFTIKLNKDTKAVIWDDQHEGGFNQEDDAVGIVVDSNNEVIVTGNSLQYPGSGENINSVYTLKYNGSSPATILWKGQYNGTGGIDDRATAVASAIDGSRNIAIVGYGKKTPTNEDIYLIKYSPNPSIDAFGKAIPLWHATPYDGGGNDYPSGIAFDRDGNLFITGYTETAQGSGIFNSFTAKYCGITGLPTCAGKNQGEIIWSHVYPGSGDNRAKSLAVDDDNNLYVTGYTTIPGNGKDFLLIKYDGKAVPSDQRVIWEKSANGGNSGDDEAVSVKVDPIDNNVIAGGTVLTAAGDHDFRIIRYTPDGTVSWDTTYLRPGSTDHMNALGLDISGNIFAAGHTDSDSLSVKYSYDGTLIGATVYNSPANGVDEANALTINSLGDAFVAGFSRNASAGPNGANDDYLVYKVAGVALQAPYPFTATPNYTQAILSWSDNSSVEAGFHLERKLGACDSSFPWVPLSVSPLAANTAGYTDNGLTIGEEYCYRVRAYNSDGETTRWIERSSLMQIPPQPSTFTATAADSATVNLSWTDSTTNESGFRIERCEGNVCDFSTLDSGFPQFAAANAVTYPDTSVCANTTYRYRILAYKTNSAGTGNEWETTYTTVSSPVSTPVPSKPTGFSATRISETRIRLSWTDTTGNETGFKIERCTVADCSTTEPVATVSANATTYDHTSLTPDTLYRYQVRATKSTGCGWDSDPSSSASATTTNIAPTLTAAAASTTQINLSWNDTTETETGFSLERCTGSCDFSVLDSGFPVPFGANTPTLPSANYTFNNTLNDSSANALHLTGSTPTYDESGLALNTGTSFQSAATGVLNTDTHVIEFDIKVRGTNGGWTKIFGYNAGGSDRTPGLWMEPGNSRIHWRYDPGSTGVDYLGINGNNGTPFVIGTWYHVKGVKNGANFKAYVNGILVVDIAVASPKTAGTAPLWFGGANVTLKNFVIYSTATVMTSTLSYQDTTVCNSQTYKYRVTATPWNTPYSNTAVVATATPLAPSVPAATRVSESEIKVTWTDNTSDETGFKIDRCSDAACATVLQTFTIDPNLQQFNDTTGLSHNTTYHYRVRAYKTAACSGGWDIAAASIVNTSTTLLDPSINPAAATAITTTCNDLRFTDEDGTTVLSHYIESGCNTNSTKFHVKYPSIPTGGKTVYAYYGTPAATNIANGSTTWNFFEDFTGSVIDPAKWTIVDSTGFTVANGLLHGTNTTGFLTSIATISGGYTLQALARVTSLPANGVTTLGIYTGWANNFSWLNHPGTFFYSNNAGYTANPTTPPSGTTQNDWMIYSIVVKDAATITPTIYDVDRAVTYWSPGDLSNNLSGRKIALGKRFDGGNIGQGYAADWDWIRIRKYASPAPSFSLIGSEEAGTFALTGGTWGVRRPMSLAYTGGGVTDYQVTGYLDTTSLASDQITINWTDTTATETRFIVERCTGSGCDAAFTAMDTYYAPANSSSFSDRNVVAATHYCYRVTAEKETATSWLTSPSAAVCANTSTVPAKPTLTVTEHETTMDLSWSDTATGENAFVIQRCKGTGCDINSPDQTFTLTPNQSSYSDTSVCSDDYSYRIKIVKYGANGWETPYSDTVTKHTVSPGAPTFTSATRISDSRIDLVWQDNTGDETGFEIERCEGALCDFSAKTTILVATNATSYNDANLKPNILYRYRLRAYKTGGTCGWPSAYSADVRETTTTVTAPTSPIATAQNTTQANLTWTDTVSNETGFSLLRCKDAGCTPAAAISAVPGPDSTSHNDTEICADSVYTYQIKGVNTLATFSNSGAGCWTSRAALSMANFSANFLTRFTITKDPDMKADFSDIRFYDGTELPYWIESSSAGSATVWVKTGTKNNIYLYFGNSDATSSSSQSAVFGSGLVGYWPFNDTAGKIAGSTADTSGKGNDLSFTGFANPYGVVAGGVYSGNALSLNGSSSYLKKDAPSGLPTGGIASVEAWIYPKGYSADASFTGIVSFGPRSTCGATLLLSIQNSGRPSTATWCNDFVPGTAATATLNAWNHIAVVLDGTANATLYMNGQAVNGPLSGSMIPNITPQNLAIGMTDYPGRYFNGLIDEVRIYNRALTSQEVSGRYAAALPTVTVQAKEQPGGCLSPDYLFDGPLSTPFTVVTPVIGNQTADADFENSSTSWTGTVGTVTGTSFDTTTSYSGKKSFKLAATGAVLGRQQTVAVTPGKQYILSGMIKTALTTGTAQCDIVGTGIDSVGITKTGTSDWSHLEAAPETIPAGTTSVVVRCFANGTPNGSAWFDMVQFVAVPPISLSATRVSETQINLAWSDLINDKSGYRLERCNLATCNDGDFVQLDSDFSSNTTNYNDVVLDPSLNYTYRVKAFKTATCGWTVNSNTAVTTVGITPPGSVTATAASTTEINLTWTDTSSSETGFKILRCETAGCSGFSELAQTLAPDVTSFTDTSVCPGVTYRYQIAAYKDGLSQGGGACWTRYKEITVNDFIPAFQIRFTVTYDSDMKSDFSDLRFYDQDANIELPYWFESVTNSTSAVVWLKTGSSSTVRMFYGNGSAHNASNANSVFELYDDFAGTTINANRWQEIDTGANYIAQNNGLVVNGGTGSWNTGMYTKTSFVRPFIFEATVMTTDYYNMMIGAKNTGAGNSYTDYTYATDYYSWGPNIYVYEDGNSRGDSGLDISNNVWKYLRLEVLPTGAKYYSGDSGSSYSTYYTSSYSSLSPLKVGFVNNNKFFQAKNMRVRRYATTEPTAASFGTEQVLGSCPVFSGQWTSNSAPTGDVTTLSYSTPDGLNVTATSDTTYNLSWNDTNNDESGFQVERCLDAGSGCTPAPMAPVVATGSNVLTYNDSTASDSQKYCYRVRATKTAACSWNSGYSNIACDISFPLATTDLTATAIHSRGVHLSWTDDADDEEGYEIEIQAWNGMWALVKKVLGGNVTSYDHTEGLEPSRQYRYRIRPFRGTDKSPYSNIAQVTMPSYATNPPVCP